ncbi:unnamed protein product [Aphanomyces euteiches]|uniref:t-SNARE coiled-coil homology domain-containing protein n=1 Tax=Aphanomyces euteiches TaxID=100861 RepID=A0A6G0WYZ3_9STRA|nr:hypothetical protein Ae201684_010268 [Aphanomyces euteiches]KAH9076280.1 hypothetical protein Ae201684P_012766 [Aphanomyces euteiches]KAH9143517.1 hypothetical protein AeRB84_012494 [Aphanomyces euteiches]
MEASLVEKSAGPSASGDPYYVFKEELESKVSSIHHSYKRWKQILDLGSSSPTKEFPKLTEDLKKDVTSSERSLGFLEQSIRAIESDRTKYSHIDRVELSARKAFVSSTRHDLMSISTEITSDAVKARIQRDERKLLRASSSSVKTPSSTIDRNAILVDEKARQQQIVKDQDADLDQLDVSVKRLGHVAVEINTEIKSQNKMLDDIELDMDDTQERMNFVMLRMSRLLKTKDTCQLGSILLLMAILVVLVFLVIYT